jgi:hypothetical protein
VQNAVSHAELGAATGAMTFLRSLGGALGVATSGTIMSASLSGSMSDSGGRIDIGALTEHGMQALAGLNATQHLAISDAYRAALTGCFLLSGVVMTVAFALVLGLPEIRLRSGVDDTAPAASSR